MPGTPTPGSPSHHRQGVDDRDAVEPSGAAADICRERGDELPNCGLFGSAEIRLCSCGKKYQAGGFGRRRRLAVRPGLAGMWQVSGRSDITNFEEVVALDTEYICNFSLGLYLKIFFKTIMVVLGRKGLCKDIFSLFIIFNQIHEDTLEGAKTH